MLGYLDGMVAVIVVSANLFKVNGFQHSANNNIEQVDAVGMGEDVCKGDCEGDFHAI